MATVLTVRIVPWWGVVSSAMAPVLLVGGWTVAAGRQPPAFDPVADTVSALAAVRDGNLGRMRLWLIATAVLGLVFLGSQAFEWSLLFREGIFPSTNLFGATFFTTTGFHGSHVLVGVLWMIGVIARASKGGVTPENNLSVEMVGLYWHFVDLVWVVLFTVIYLI